MFMFLFIFTTLFQDSIIQSNISIVMILTIDRRSSAGIETHAPIAGSMTVVRGKQDIAV